MLYVLYTVAINFLHTCTVHVENYGTMHVCKKTFIRQHEETSCAFFINPEPRYLDLVAPPPSADLALLPAPFPPFLSLPWAGIAARSP